MTAQLWYWTYVYNIKKKEMIYVQFFFFFLLHCVFAEDAEQWADEHDIDIEIEPAEAVRAGRTIPQFLLAHRTYHPDLDQSKMLKDEAGEFPLLDLKLWNQIHIPFEPAIDEKVYKVKGYGGSVLDNRLFLRMLYEYITADEGVLEIQTRTSKKKKKKRNNNN
ncbi:hypothetical protein RFI_15126 [Reticulomyxa filosa]|uniref:Uncharacterized protein n=1 Tax=Reticulomyxa filosa TaxID=46433 RepID=X6N8K0_RETFI|nr:hypothetical protein RFI_15126 [Reticulomyxa filosa]|eukprot:ETO22074.1 hypothetical protein RFI_15126 [Reticulomyxa filosa]